MEVPTTDRAQHGPEQTTSLIVILAVIIIKYTQGFYYQLLLSILNLHSPGHTSNLRSGLTSPSAYSPIPLCQNNKIMTTEINTFPYIPIRECIQNTLLTQVRYRESSQTPPYLVPHNLIQMSHQSVCLNLSGILLLAFLMIITLLTSSILPAWATAIASLVSLLLAGLHCNPE